MRRIVSLFDGFFLCKHDTVFLQISPFNSIYTEFSKSNYIWKVAEQGNQFHVHFLRQHTNLLLLPH